MDDPTQPSMKRSSQFLIACLAAAAIVAALAWGSAPRTAPEPSPASASATATSQPYTSVQFKFGRGYIGDNWQVYFNEPDASVDKADYKDGIDAPLASAMDAAEETLDIAVFELNSRRIYEAILAAQRRGVAVRIVTDDKHGLADDSNTELRELEAAGVAIVADNRSGLMHNKFTIIDQRAVWTGSWNYTLNGTFRNNNNILVIESAEAAAVFQAEFEEMFERGEFGARSAVTSVSSASSASSDSPVSSNSSIEDIIRIGVDDKEGKSGISIIFAPEADEIAALRAAIQAAQSSIHFMSFVFSLDELAEAMLEKLDDPNFVLRGVFEKRNSTASWSQLPRLHCAGVQPRQDGNPYTLHHKVIIIDDDTVVTGSFNYSNSAAQKNDENIVIIRDQVIASLYLEEWRRVWDSAQEVALGDIICD